MTKLPEQKSKRILKRINKLNMKNKDGTRLMSQNSGNHPAGQSHKFPIDYIEMYGCYVASILTVVNTAHTNTFTQSES